MRTSARLVAARTMLARQDVLVDALLSAARTLAAHLHCLATPICTLFRPAYRDVNNRLAVSTARSVDLVVKIFCSALSERAIALKATMVIENVDTLKRSGCILLDQTSKQRDRRHVERYWR